MGEHKSKRTNSFLGILFDNNPDCLLVYRLKNLQLEYANPNAISAFGAQLNARRAFSFFDDESKNTLNTIVGLMKSSGNLDSFEFSAIVQKKSGKKHPTDVIGKTIFMDSDIYLVLFLPHVKNIFPALQKHSDYNGQSDMNPEDFSIHHIANELIEPLRAVSTYIQLLERNYSKNLDASGRKFLNYIVQGSQQLKNVIDDMQYYEQHSYKVTAQSETP